MTELFNTLQSTSKEIKKRHVAKNKKVRLYQNSASKAFLQKSLKITGNIPVNLNVKNNDSFIFISHEQTYLTHGLHKYPAKFFPELPKWLIQKYSKPGDKIIDPFSGSGTSNIEALLLNRNSVGIDIDPFARFMSKVKTTKLDIKKLKRVEKEIFKSLLKYDKNLVNRNDIPDFPYIEHWFQPFILLELTYIKHIISTLDTTKNIRNFYLLCFSSIIRKISNASNECTRTVIRKNHNKNIKSLDALHGFYNAVVVNILLGNPWLSEFTRQDFMTYRSNNKAVSANTLNHYHAYLSAVFNELIRIDQIKTNPLDKLKRLTVEPTELSYLEKDEVKLLMSALKVKKSDAYMVTKICLSTGTRWREACGIKAKNVRNNQIHVLGKNGKIRHLSITPDLAREIKDKTPFCDPYNAPLNARLTN